MKRCFGTGSHIGGVIVFVAAFLTAAPVSAMPFTKAVFFGDSVSDTGNFCILFPGDDQCVDPYFQGRISNGPVWSELFAEGLGVGAQAALLGGTNFAVAGAETGDLLGQGGLPGEIPVSLGLIPVPGVNPMPIDPGALYVIWIGGNDILRPVRGGGVPNITGAVENILNGIVTLQAFGAANFLISNLPDTGLAADLDPAQSLAARDFTIAFNNFLASALSEVAGINITLFDAFSVIEEIVASGLVETETPCLGDQACKVDPMGQIADGFLLFDDIHATTAIHAQLASAAGATVMAIPEPPVLLLNCIGIVALSFALRWRVRPPTSPYF